MATIASVQSGGCAHRYVAKKGEPSTHSTGEQSSSLLLSKAQGPAWLEISAGEAHQIRAAFNYVEITYCSGDMVPMWLIGYE